MRDARARRAGSANQLVDSAVDARVDDRLELGARGAIAEDDAAERGAIQRAVRRAATAGPKRSDDLGQRRACPARPLPAPGRRRR